MEGGDGGRGDDPVRPAIQARDAERTGAARGTLAGSDRGIRDGATSDVSSDPPPASRGARRAIRAARTGGGVKRVPLPSQRSEPEREPVAAHAVQPAPLLVDLPELARLLTVSVRTAERIAATAGFPGYDFGRHHPKRRVKRMRR